MSRAGDMSHRYGCSSAGCTAFATKTEHYWTNAHGWVRGDDYCDEHAPSPSEYVKVGPVSRG